MAMPKDTKRQRGVLDKFEVGGQFGPIDDRSEYERRLDSLPPDEKELAHESTRFADLCRYFSDQKMDIPPHVLDQVGALSKCPIADRIRVFKAVNKSLMEYLDDAGEDPQVRQ
jgi:hypothetical protein